MYRTLSELRTAYELEKYRAYQAAEANLTEQILVLKESIGSVQSSASQREPVAGGAAQDARWLNTLCDMDSARQALESCRRKLRMIERGLSVLDERERLVLTRFHIDRQRGHVEKLCEELFLEKSQVYDLREKALKRFTFAYLGTVE